MKVIVRHTSRTLESKCPDCSASEIDEDSGTTCVPVQEEVIEMDETQSAEITCTGCNGKLKLDYGSLWMIACGKDVTVLIACARDDQKHFIAMAEHSIK